jgi:hypothetical protein|tara:strand:- start:2205 stop:2840 length:636 start_codon:yes stop_codon:yes gene_type:complete
MGPFIIPAGIKSGAATAMKYAPYIKQGWDWLTGGGPSRSGSMSKMERNYLKQLKLRAERGMDPSQVNQLMSQTTRSVGVETDISKANVMGTSAVQGLEDSSVMAEQLKDVDLAGSAQVATTARNVAAENLRIQEQAEEELGAYGMQQTNQNYSEALNHYSGLDNILGTISGLGGDYLTGLANKSKLEEYQNASWWKDLDDEVKFKIIQNFS